MGLYEEWTGNSVADQCGPKWCQGKSGLTSDEPHTRDTRLWHIEPGSSASSTSRARREQLSLEFRELGFQLTQVERGSLVLLGLGLCVRVQIAHVRDGPRLLALRSLLLH